MCHLFLNIPNAFFALANAFCHALEILQTICFSRGQALAENFIFGPFFRLTVKASFRSNLLDG